MHLSIDHISYSFFKYIDSTTKFHVTTKLKDLQAVAQSDAAAAYLWGFLAAFFSGLFAVYLVLQLIKRGKFEYFAYYCFLAGTAAMIYFGAR